MAKNTTTTVVFLHIPKTAGQTIHKELSRVIGAAQTSPVRTHTQARPGAGPGTQMPPGYRLYSGHLDWTGLDDLPEDRFVFSVLRDPMERIASFYFYLLDQAMGLSEAELNTPARTGMRMIRTLSADDYFFGGDAGWRKFIRDHYDNFYCSYFATRRMRGWSEVSKMPRPELLDRALTGTRALDRLYSVNDLAALERDVQTRLGARIRVADTYVNVGPQGRDTGGPQGRDTGGSQGRDTGGSQGNEPRRRSRRWPVLMERLESDATAARLDRFARLDVRLMERLEKDGRFRP